MYGSSRLAFRFKDEKKPFLEPYLVVASLLCCICIFYEAKVLKLKKYKMLDMIVILVRILSFFLLFECFLDQKESFFVYGFIICYTLKGIVTMRTIKWKTKFGFGFLTGIYMIVRITQEFSYTFLDILMLTLILFFIIFFDKSRKAQKTTLNIPGIKHKTLSIRSQNVKQNNVENE